MKIEDFLVDYTTYVKEKQSELEKRSLEGRVVIALEGIFGVLRNISEDISVIRCNGVPKQ